MLGGVVLYVCWPVIAAGAVTVTASGTTAEAMETFLAQQFTNQAATQVLGASGRV